MSITCSPVSLITCTFEGSDSTKISMKVGETIDITGYYECLVSGSGCTHQMTFANTSPSGPSFSWVVGGDDPAAEETKYTHTWTAPSTTGLWKLTTDINWYTENDPRAAPVVLYTSAPIYVVVWDENTKPTGGFTEQSAPSGSWTEQTAPSGGFTEQSKPAGSWTEQSKPSGTWTEQAN